MPKTRAAGLVALLGWDPWDGLNALEEENDDTLHAYLDILRPDGGPEESETCKMLSRAGTKEALRLLHERASEAGRLDDDGCPPDL